MVAVDGGDVDDVQVAQRVGVQCGVALTTHPSLPIALELGWTKPQPHWIGLPVSSGGEDGYSLDVKVTVALVRELV